MVTLIPCTSIYYNTLALIILWSLSMSIDLTYKRISKCPPFADVSELLSTKVHEKSAHDGRSRRGRMVSFDLHFEHQQEKSREQTRREELEWPIFILVCCCINRHTDFNKRKLVLLCVTLHTLCCTVNISYYTCRYLLIPTG